MVAQAERVVLRGADTVQAARNEGQAGTTELGAAALLCVSMRSDLAEAGFPSLKVGLIKLT